MRFNNHSNLEGQHAFLGGSNYHWLNYTPEKLATTYRNMRAAEEGTELHALAADLIKHHIRVSKVGNPNLAQYVNDAIGYKLTPEVPLVYSKNVFGTADTIGFNKQNRVLRIHDLKTGTTPAHMEQLMIYTALFFLEYKDSFPNPGSDVNEIILQIYQSNNVIAYSPSIDEIAPIMDKIITFDRIITQINKEEGIE